MIKKKIIVWGNGKYYQNRKTMIAKSFYEIIAFVHGDCKFWGESYEGKCIIAPNELCQIKYDYVVVAVKNKTLILEKLDQLNVPPNKVIDINELDSCRIEWLYPGYVDHTRISVNTYFFDFPNVGDSLNMFLMEKIFNVKIKKSNVADADMLGIGSLLEDIFESKNDVKEEVAYTCDKPLYIWGTGAAYDEEHWNYEKLKREIQVVAVRGEKTKKILERALGANIQCVLADPGLLVSGLIPHQMTQYELGIIPHHSEGNNTIFNQIKQKYENSIIIDVTKNPIEVICAIAKCKQIISTSLHGLIIADAFGIPNLWCKCSEALLGGEFKFRDYYSAYGIEIDPYVLNEESILKIGSIREQYRVSCRSVEEKKIELKKAFRYIVEHLAGYPIKNEEKDLVSGNGTVAGKKQRVSNNL